MPDTAQESQFVEWFRQSSPYIHAFRGRTFVLSFDGAAVMAARFSSLIADIALLNSLGIRLVLVSGARPQIEQRLGSCNATIDYVNGLRITDDAAMHCVKEANGSVRVEIEARLSMGVANSPMAGASIRVASGNFVTAKPLGIRDGIDYQHTGTVRRIDSQAIQAGLEAGAIVLLSPLGYSPTGEVFNLTANEVATAAAIALNADKLLFLTEAALPQQNGQELTLERAQQLIQQRAQESECADDYLHHAVDACCHGVRRAHLIPRHLDGSLLLELFTRDGVGLMVTADTFEGLRRATIEDVGGLLELITPLENEGILVRRSREQLELEIEHFTVVDRDGTIIACAALFPFTSDSEEISAELACLAIHPDYQGHGRGESLLQEMERRAKQRKIRELFVSTTHATHWFQEHGYNAMPFEKLPVERQRLYNYQRKSKLFSKTLNFKEIIE